MAAKAACDAALRKSKGKVHIKEESVGMADKRKQADTEKINQVEMYLGKLRKIAGKSIKKGAYQKACAAINACARIEYLYNQHYTDFTLENYCMQISKTLFGGKHIPNRRARQDAGSSTKGTVLFYDGFGLDTRGLALIYLKALCVSGYQVHYVTVAEGEGRQPQIMGLLAKYGAVADYLPRTSDYAHMAGSILRYFTSVHPEYAFFYTIPYDVSAVIAFQAARGMAKRYQINLTDHAFWLGVSCFDVCIEFREYGAGISGQYRGIRRDSIRILPYYPYVDKSVTFQGFPFEAEGKTVIFSGGALYKTFDKDMVYYKMVGHMLSDYQDVIFLYAGEGDGRGIQMLQQKYRHRVYWIPERADLYQVMGHSDFYLNTYPMLGGLMTQYAALAGCIPLTLLYESPGVGDGLLLGQDRLGIMFRRPKDLLDEFHKLMEDSCYKERVKNKLRGCLISESRFGKLLQGIMEGTDNGGHMGDVRMDTSRFRGTYLDRLKIEECRNAVATRDNISLAANFPGIFIRRAIRKLQSKVGLCR